MSDEPKKQRFSRPVSVEVPGTPEQVWAAIATGPGIGSWLFKSEVEERPGGAVTFHIAPGMESSGRVTVWEPPKRFAYEEPNWMEGAEPLGTEFVIEPQGGGTCVVRLVHSLFAREDEWNDEFDGFEKGWRGFFKVLRLYLAKFAGQHARTGGVQVEASGTEADVWRALQTKLGLAREAGAPWSTEGSGAPRMHGTIEVPAKGTDQEAVLLVSEPLSGIAIVSVGAWGGKVLANLSLYAFGQRGPDLEKVEGEWKAWLTSMFAAKS